MVCVVVCVVCVVLFCCLVGDLVCGACIVSFGSLFWLGRVSWCFCLLWGWHNMRLLG